MAPLKQCRCGRTYERDSWQALPFVGRMTNGRTSEPEVVELRLCTCGSSLAIPEAPPE
jgi:hypothetical protein